MSAVKKVTIRKKLFRTLFVVFFAVLVLTIFPLSTILYYSSISNSNKIIKEKNISIKYFIEGYFKKIYSDVEFLSNLREVRNLPSLDKESLSRVLNIYKSIQNADSDINYIYSGYQDGSLVINNYTPPKDFNSTIRPWYEEAIKARPYITRGVPYREIKSKELLISVSKVLFDDKNRVSGVISIDTSLQKIANLLEEKNSIYKKSHSFVTTLEGKIIISQDKSFLYKNIFDIVGFRIYFNKDSGEFDCNLDYSKKFIYYNCMDSLKWVVLTVIDKNEVVRPIVLQIATIVLILVIIIALFGWIISASLRKQFIFPLVELKKRVHSIVADNFDDNLPDIYKQDEIGFIAADIEQLARSELYKKNIELRNMNKELKKLSDTDALTGLFNRRKINIEIEKEYQRSLRYASPFALIMFDIDWFKKINDTYGHQVGDIVLQELSKLAKQTVRSTDIVSRWGGEEFLILCTQTDLKTAYNLAQRLREDTQNYKFNGDIKMTISLGAHEFNGKDSIDDLLKKVDDKLYKAKQSGRNKVVMQEV